MVQRRLSLFALTILVLTLAAACGAEPVTMSDVPMYPGAEPMAPEQSAMADQLADIIRDSSGSEGVSVEVTAYSLPDGTTWDQVRGFYESELAGSEWNLENDLRNESDIFNTVGWSRGSGASEQALVVGHVSDVSSGGAFMIVGLFSE